MQADGRTTAPTTPAVAAPVVGAVPAATAR